MKKSRGLVFLYGAIVAAVVGVAGCSGGGGGTAPGANVPASTPTPTPSPGPTSTGATQTATAILQFPHGKAQGVGPDYVSPNSTSVSVQIKLLNGQPPPSWVTASETVPLIFDLNNKGKNCSTNDGMATCTITIPAPPGNVDYIFHTDAVLPGGQTAILDYNEEVIQIKQGINNQVAISLEGVVQKATVTIPKPLVPGADMTETMTLTAYDATGAVITGTKQFQSPFKLQDADQYGTKTGPLYQYSSFLTVNGEPSGGSKSVQVNSPTDVIQIVYYGIAMSDFQIAASGNGKDKAWSSSSIINLNLNPIILPGTFIDNANHGGQPSDPNYNQNTLLLKAGDPATSITPSEVGRTNFPYDACNSQKNQIFTCLALQDLPRIGPSCGSLNNQNPNDIAPFNPGPPVGQTIGYTYTITPQNPGLCVEQFVDALSPGHAPPPSGNALVDGTIWVKVQ